MRSPPSVEDEVGIASVRRDGRVDAVEQPVEADALVALEVGLAQADVDHLHASRVIGCTLYDAKAVHEDFGPLLRGESPVYAVASGQLAPTGQQVAGLQLPAAGHVEVALHRRAPVQDAPVQAVPPLGVHAQGGADVVAGNCQGCRCPAIMSA